MNADISDGAKEKAFFEATQTNNIRGVKQHALESRPIVFNEGIIIAWMHKHLNILRYLLKTREKREIELRTNEGLDSFFFNCVTQGKPDHAALERLKQRFGNLSLERTARTYGGQTIFHHAVEHNLQLVIDIFYYQNCENIVADDGTTPLSKAEGEGKRDMFDGTRPGHELEMNTSNSSYSDSGDGIASGLRTLQVEQDPLGSSHVSHPTPSTSNEQRGPERMDFESIFIFPHAMRRWLALGKDPNVLNRTGHSLLYSHIDDINCVKELISNGADIHLRTHRGMTALHAACVAVNAEVVFHLLEIGSDIMARDENGDTPLHILVRRLCTFYSSNEKYQEGLLILEYLIEHGAELSTTKDSPNSPFFLAASLGDIQVMELLLKHGASMSDMGRFTTPLAEACYRSQLKVVQFLVNHGVDVDAHNAIMGESALLIANAKAALPICEILTLAGARERRYHVWSTIPKPQTGEQQKRKHRRIGGHTSDFKDVTLTLLCRKVIFSNLAPLKTESVRSLLLPTTIMDFIIEPLVSSDRQSQVNK